MNKPNCCGQRDLISRSELLNEMIKYKAFGELTARSAIRMVKKAPAVPQFGKWISVKDRLPEVTGIYLTCDNTRPFCVQSFVYNATDKVFYHYGRSEDVSYWMLMPKEPKEDKSDG